MMTKTKILKFILACVCIASGLYSCKESTSERIPQDASEGILFSRLSSENTGITFQNHLVETEASNYYQYMYSYIGGGVAAADFNNDGLEDLFFTSNSHDNKFYLNQGELSFKDYTEEAGLEKRQGFDAGVTIVDINNDGFLDIYICRAGWIQENKQFANLLYINNGYDGKGGDTKGISFSEKAEEYGLADLNRSINASFFDYDKDGDLDVYVSNSPDFEDKASAILDLKDIQNDPKTMEQKGSDRLYRNEGNGSFLDVSEKAGILPDLGFGLNPQVGDLNGDSWLDIYVCNDFKIPDFVYLNNGDGSFREGRSEIMKHISFNSMGSDIADINNDGLLDLFTLDINPEDYVRSKTTMGMTPVDRFEEMVEKGYHYNYMHNMLQLNNGNGSFREIANMAGVANTDWSWACLLADFDLDGYNDIYVTNGVYRDVIDRDANTAIIQTLRQNGRKPTEADFLTFTKMLPQQKLTNYLFKNKGDFTFEDVTSSWTNAVPSFSNGAVYSDLDNDGDLDLVVNNINAEADILRNNSRENKQANYLQIELLGPEQNKGGVGSLARIKHKDGSQLVRRLINTRGFLSAVSGRLHFGLGDKNVIEELEIIWPDGKTQKLSNMQPNQVLKLEYKNAKTPEPNPTATRNQSLVFTELNSNFRHIDPAFNDYSKQILLPHKLSQTGPAVAKADVNGDGLDDVFIGGGHTQAGQLLIASTSGKFKPRPMPAFERDRRREDVGACFFDADGDNDQDLFVVSGSYEFVQNSKLLVDRLYLNDGKGNFSKSSNKIPEISSAGSIARAADFDQDGDLDVFVGGRVLPATYPFPPRSFLLVNEGGTFSAATQKIAPDLEQIGMVNDAAWEDIDMDGDLDLIVTGEWLGIEVFINEQGQLQRSEEFPSLSHMKGWWNQLHLADVDQDGDKDIIAGNLGLNYKFHASPEKPFHVYTNDFDYNGTADVFLAKYYKGAEVPVRGKTCATQQVPHLAQKIPSFNDFASKDLAGILGPGVKSALHYEAVEFRSGIFINEGDGNFSFSPFSNEVQQSLINSIIYMDMDGDKVEDLLLAGNNYMSEIETTRADAGIGIFLKGLGKGKFEAISNLQSGFFANKDVRALLAFKNQAKTGIFVINNNDKHQIFLLNKEDLGPRT
ncbi:MAG: VCBS repeat-containing protein [Bacteroidota bacterium]